MTTETVYCPYCISPFERVVTPWGNTAQTCGRELCKQRTASWNNWITRGQVQSVLGDVNKPPKRSPLPPRMTDRYWILAEMTFGVKTEAEVTAA
jgi:hypothetical protein